MTNTVDIRPELVEWSKEAGLEVTQGSVTHDGRTVIWSKLGEVRYFISKHPTGWFIVTESERMGPEQLNFGGISMEIVERYFYGDFGLSNRSRNGLPRLHFPTTKAELAEGYDVARIDFESRTLPLLLDRSGSATAIGGIADLVEVSHYLDVPIKFIKDSFLSPDGMPLFHLRSA